MRRFAVPTFVSFLLFGGFFSCGESKEYLLTNPEFVSSPSLKPEIYNLAYSPNQIFESQKSLLKFSFDFLDRNADVIQVRVSCFDFSFPPEDVPESTQQIRGSISREFLLPNLPAGNYDCYAYLIDLSGNESNRLRMSVTVLPKP